MKDRVICGVLGIYEGMQEKIINYIVKFRISFIFIILLNVVTFIFSFLYYLNQVNISIIDFWALESYSIFIFFLTFVSIFTLFQMFLMFRSVEIAQFFLLSLKRENFNIYEKIIFRNSNTFLEKIKITFQPYFLYEILKTFIFVFLISFKNQILQIIIFYPFPLFSLFVFMLFVSKIFRPRILLPHLRLSLVSTTYFYFFYLWMGLVNLILSFLISDEIITFEIFNYSFRVFSALTYLGAFLLTFAAVNGLILNNERQDKQLATIFEFMLPSVFMFYQIFIFVTFFALGLQNPQVTVSELKTNEMIIVGKLVFRTKDRIFIQNPKNLGENLVYDAKTHDISSLTKIHLW